MMMGLETDVGKAEKIGLVGSPSSTSQLRLDIVASAVEKSLVGSIAFLKYRQDDSDTYAIGQLSEVTLKNLFAEDQIMKSLTKQRGEVPSITENQDTHTAVMMISAVFEADGDHLATSTFGTVPPTGTSIRLINQDIMNRLVAPHAGQLAYVGKVFGSDVLLPSWFRHFGDPKDGGWGDAMHAGIFGKTGSGKSVLGKMIMLSYMRHRPMSLLVLDPQGEFSKIDDEGKVKEFISGLGKTMRVYDLSTLILLPDWDLFKKILVNSQFLKRLGIRADRNQDDAADQVVGILDSKQSQSNLLGRIPLERTHERMAFDHVWNSLQDRKYLEHIYTHNTTGYSRVLSTLKNSDKDSFYAEWQKVTRLFGREGGNAHKMSDLLENIGNKNGAVTVINLSEANAPKDILWGAGIQKVMINQVLTKLISIAQNKFIEGGNLNTMVVLDEAHRFAPRRLENGDEDSSRLRSTLLDAVRTTRKFGLGWMFISQTLASLDRELIQQLRMYFFGYGLAWGSELVALKELIGGGNNSVLSLYQQFHDPASSLEGGQYSFMSVGPSSPLSFSGMPLFFNSLQFPEEFISKNGYGDNAP